MKKFVLLTLVLIVVLTSAACQPQAAKNDTIKLGWFGALSGDQAVWGQADKNGVMLTVEQVNKAGGILGKQVEVVYYDDKGEQLESINAVKRLINEDKVVGIIGTNASGRQIAVAPVVEEGKVPVISTFATNPRVTVPEENKLMKYTFRAAFIDPYSGEVTANFAWNDLGARKAAILYEISSDYSVGVRQYFSEAWAKLGGELVADEAFKTGDVDFRAQLTRIKEANPDVLIMPYMYKEVALSAKQARELGITATMLGGDGWPSLALLEMAGPAVEGSYFIDHGDIKAPNVQEFRQAYKDKYGKEIEITALMGHDAFMMMQGAIIAAGKAEPTAIRDALENLKGVKVFTGTINVDPATHNPQGKAAAIIKIENGAFKFFKMFEPMK